MSNTDVYRRYYKHAPAIHQLAKEYGVDPWTVAFEWPIERYDFNINIMRRYQDAEKRARESQENRRGR